ncbi:MAG: 6-bladed beta-propeller [Clostridiales bacterium]|nr:6-bladed beta-propeller [Clostridiales bacterium]
MKIGQFRIPQSAVMIGLGCLLLTFLCEPGLLFARPDQKPKIIPLPELESATHVRADHGKVYIQDKKDIAVYSFETGRFLKRIGRPGQGPGEFTYLGGFYQHSLFMMRRGNL